MTPVATEPLQGRGPLILASASPRRRELLARLAIPFSLVTADVQEHEDPATDPRVMVAHNAALKADWVALRHPDALVLGADTTVFLDGHALNKPGDASEARAMLRRLAGRTHTVFTGLALRGLNAGVRVDDGESSEVTFKSFGDEVIEAYLGLVHTLDKAGGYAIQEHAEKIVADYTGSIDNIMGLPVNRLKQILQRLGHLS